ncbi:hypothetical protein H0H81_010105 [Sphagnurus paluster]|uniref:PQ-loop-domain-containing protein n=1 Tax=Sphagnurus paluster TaxID=117069 RepID=A0A9P7GVW4_9AGAR|nr:hypothetical protein H0H81_010105 [Sphagnurus paluster]
MLSAPSVSELLGYTSIACWLGAQFPQVLENLRRQSCEGLALPFLANWLLGDASNLVGCILTHQLPFQTYLATYFVCIDCTLVAQYIYYTSRAKSIGTPFTHPRPLPPAARPHGVSIDRGAVRYRTLSAVAANVAATAALAAQQDDHAEHRRRWHSRTTDQARDSSQAGDLADDDDVDENALSALANSFHSEAGHESRRQRVSWSIERHRTRSGSLGVRPGLLTTPLHAVQPLPSADSLIDMGGRGRPIEREIDVELEIEPEVASPKRRSSRASKRGATMLFLSTWALFGMGTLAGGKYGFTTNPQANVGKVLAVRGLGMESVALHIPAAQLESLQGGVYHGPPSYSVPLYEAFKTEPISERAIGRIFAWMCTVLYLTSRLPQIWKNFVRKSVEGLSMYLFVFAFLGNVFYVASILSSPNMRLPAPEAAAFITESIPYLIGSAGTLMFDVTIVGQSFIYRPRHRRHGPMHSSRIEEETGLLSGDTVARQASGSTVLPRGRSSRTRTSV